MSTITPGVVDTIYPWCSLAEPDDAYDECEFCGTTSHLVWEIMVCPDYDESTRSCTPCAAKRYTQEVLTAAAMRDLAPFGSQA